MNWYIRYKQAQIWEPDDESDFQIDRNIRDMVVYLYKLNYVRDMLLQRPFSGHEKRREKILEQIDDRAYEVIEELKAILEGTFSKWLSGHAITNPEEWGRSRAIGGPNYEDFEDYAMSIGHEDMIAGVVDEYIRSLHAGHNPMNPAYGGNSLENEWRRILSSEVMPNLERYPALLNAFSLHAEEEKEWRKNELVEIGLDQFNEYYGTQFTTDDEAINYIDNMDTSDSIASLLDNMTMEELANSLYQTGNLYEVLSELYTNIVFPVWYGRWSAEGIDETRENVENMYNELQQIDENDIAKSLTIINRALGTAHQSGDMLDYIDEYGGAEGSYELKQELDALTQGRYVPVWNTELREIGVQI